MKGINRWTLAKLSEVEASLLSDLAEITGKLIQIQLSRKAILEDECRYTAGAGNGLADRDRPNDSGDRGCGCGDVGVVRLDSVRRSVK